jgi:hypothetical protein
MNLKQLRLDAPESSDVLRPQLQSHVPGFVGQCSNELKGRRLTLGEPAILRR